MNIMNVELLLTSKELENYNFSTREMFQVLGLIVLLILYELQQNKNRLRRKSLLKKEIKFDKSTIL